MGQCPYHTETIQLILAANPLTGSYMVGPNLFVKLIFHMVMSTNKHH